MSKPVALDRQTQEILERKLRKHLADEYGFELGQFEALDLLDWLAETLGPLWYNQALYDAQAVLRKRADDLVEAVSAVEKPVKL
ncbi:MAG: DUF2164 family protein [Caulobacteraceae bacterium]|nr:DUF2164 domain-containing protein [Caulobacter sp.]RYF92867.1 MAG: DUF2164 family protein [Caulobacteraceae bacterium]